MPDPELSIIIAASHAAHTLSECLRCLAPQLSTRASEVFVVASSADEARITREQLPSANVIAVERDTLIPIMWAQGVLQARGRVIALTIATCIPDAHWVAEILRAHAEYHTAIGGAIENAIGSSPVDWAVYFVRYTSYMLPFAAGPMEVPGDNGTYKRVALDAQRDWIRRYGFWENEINARLREEKRSLWGDPRIIVYHNKSFSLLGFSKQRFVHGRIFGTGIAASVTEFGAQFTAAILGFVVDEANLRGVRTDPIRNFLPQPLFERVLMKVVVGCLLVIARWDLAFLGIAGDLLTGESAHQVGLALGVEVFIFRKLGTACAPRGTRGRIEIGYALRIEVVVRVLILVSHDSVIPLEPAAMKS